MKQKTQRFTCIFVYNVCQHVADVSKYVVDKLQHRYLHQQYCSIIDKGKYFDRYYH